jgi:hypothetical protein
MPGDIKGTLETRSPVKRSPWKPSFNEITNIQLSRACATYRCG